MTLKAIEAATAYANTNAIGKQPGLDARDNEPKANFADLVKGAAETASSSLRKGEAMAMQSVTGETELVDIVTAVTNAELTLQTVVAVRDRVVQAYQDVIKMPI